MSSSDELSFGYDNGWFNGNPLLMIKAGTYAKYRSMLKGFDTVSMAEFDALEKAEKPVRDQAEKERLERQKKNDAEADKKHKERLAARKAALAKRSASSEKKPK